MIKPILRFEGLAVFLVCIYFYNQLGAPWLLFVSLWLLPDISMVGYLRDKKMGAIMYNVAHNYILAWLIIFLGLWQGNNFIRPLA